MDRLVTDTYESYIRQTVDLFREFTKTEGAIYDTSDFDAETTLKLMEIASRNMLADCIFKIQDLGLTVINCD